MKIFIIAQLVNGKKLLGYRMLDVDANNQVNDFPLATIQAVLSKPETANIIQNAKLVNGEIVGTNGQLTRYTRVNPNGTVDGDSPLVVINKIDDVGYTVCDFKGMVKRMKNSDVVEYAKSQGIANGKVIVQDNVEYISSISDSYEQIKLTPSKVGAKGRVDLKIHMGGDVATIKKHTEQDLNAELQYNDVFSAMTPEQRAVLKQYYTWYTVDVYRSLAKNVRLNLAPGKAEKLAQLRGIDKWQFAGVNDSYLEGRFNAKCELGHNLRYEYFAIPEELADGVDARIKDWRVHGYNGFRTSHGASGELKDNGAIVFGETCAGDFFNIAPEDMKKLVKTRKIMSDEIELTADIITNSTQELFERKCSYLYDCIKAMGSGTKVVDVFGEKVGYTLLSFAKENIPFPKSLVILAGDKIREDREKFFNAIIPGCPTTIHKIFETEYKNNDRNTLAHVHRLLDYISDFTIEGDYQYNPLTDTECTRRDIGAYNKETRQQRSYILRVLKNETAFNERTFNSLSYLQRFIKVIAKALEVARYTEDYLDKSETMQYAFTTGNIRETRLVNKLASLAENNKYTMEQANELDLMSSCLSCTDKYGLLARFNRRTFEYGRTLRSPRPYERLEALLESFESIVMVKQLDEFVSDTIGLIEAEIEADKEAIAKAEAERVRKCRIMIKQASKTQYELFSDRWAAQIPGKYLVGDKIVYDNDYYLGYMAAKIYLEDVESCEEVGEIEFRAVCRDCERALENKREAERLARETEEEKKRLEELAKQEAEKIKRELEEEEQRRKQEEQRNKDFEADEKMQKLKDLLSNIPEDKVDYGISVAKNIIDRAIPYAELSSKQQWRIDETLKSLGATDLVDANKATSDKKKLEDEPDVANKVDKLLEILKSNDKDKIRAVDKASRLAFDIARTVKYKGEFSSKQLKHIDKAYEAIK